MLMERGKHKNPDSSALLSCKYLDWKELKLFVHTHTDNIWLKATADFLYRKCSDMIRNRCVTRTVCLQDKCCVLLHNLSSTPV